MDGQRKELTKKSTNCAIGKWQLTCGSKYVKRRRRKDRERDC